MSLAITINAILSVAVLVVIVGPIVWAIRTWHRDELVQIAKRRQARHAPAYAARPARDRQYEPPHVAGPLN